MILNLFYEEKDDRWFPGDRHARALIRQMLLGKPQVSGQMRVFLNLCAGLDRLGIRYRVNDYRHIQKNPDELACILGRPFVLKRIKWQNPILFGPACYDHPIDQPNLMKLFDIKQVLVPGAWYVDMCRPYWNNVKAWPVGIDTDVWKPSPDRSKSFDVLLYDKVRWEHDRFDADLIEPIRSHLRKNGLSVLEMRYGSYKEAEFLDALSRCRTMIFLCEHESQGIAYQQALSSGVPIMAWDRGGTWQDPKYYPDKVVCGSVTSVPYWDSRCGMKFRDAEQFRDQWSTFWRASQSGRFDPRAFILDTMTLEKRSSEYLGIAETAFAA